MSDNNVTKGKFLSFFQTISLFMIIIAMVVPRIIDLDRFVTPDEKKWLHRSANFLTALIQKDFEHTFQREHPGVTIMWAGTAGFLVRYPQFITLEPGQLDRIGDLPHYMENNNIDPIIALESGRIFIVLGIVTSFLLAFWYAFKVLGLQIASLGFLFVALNPFSIALGRLLHLDALVSALMLLSILALMAYLYRGRRSINLVVSAIAAGLSWLTKSPALFLLPFFCLLMLIELFNNWTVYKHNPIQTILRESGLVLVWFALAVITFTVFFPAMWVTPLETVNKIFAQAIFYASEGHGSDIFFNGRIYSDGVRNIWFYPINYLWRATPLTVLGLFLLGLAFVFRRRIQFNKEIRKSSLIFVLFIILFTIFMTVGAKKFDRYLLPVFAPLDILAAVGWITILTATYHFLRERLSSRVFPRSSVIAIGALLAGAFVWQCWGVMQTAPYYLSYYNPLLGGAKRAPQVMMIGWGEGLDQAARYLNESPEAGNLQVMSWYFDGPFSYFFDGTTLMEDFPVDPEDLPKVDYIVIYFHQLQRQLPSKAFLQFIEQHEMEYVVFINSLPYAYIYRMY